MKRYVMVNKPKFNIFKNITYALDGMVETFRSEKSFRIQFASTTVVAFALFFVPLSLKTKMILYLSTWLILIAEAFNSAIERVVDMVTKEYNELAKQAKDIGAFGVLLAFILTLMIWIVTLYSEFEGVIK